MEARKMMLAVVVETAEKVEVEVDEAAVVVDVAVVKDAMVVVVDAINSRLRLNRSHNGLHAMTIIRRPNIIHRTPHLMNQLNINWEMPKPRTYPIPPWVRETGTVLSKWMLAPDGNASIDLTWDTWGYGYTDVKCYEAFWDKPHGPAGSGGGGQSHGGGSWGGGFGGSSGGSRSGGTSEIEEGMQGFQLSQRPGGRGGRGGRGRGDASGSYGGQRGGGRGDGGGWRDRGGRGGSDRSRGGGEWRGGGGGGGGGGRGGGGDWRGGGGRDGRSGGGGGGICRVYNTPDGCKLGSNCKMRHE
ncbi:hypothetical protein RUND412_004861 [Rhizina undulata]